MSDSSNADRRLRVALDAMGGDLGPAEMVKGAVEAAKTQNVEMVLVGDQDLVQTELEKHDVRKLPVRIVPSEGKVLDDEHPVRALRRKPDSSISVATKLLRDGEADALVTMGSTGAAMASAMLYVGLIEGLERPALGGPFMGLAPRTVVLDIGSNVDCRPGQMLSFGIMGSVFADRILEISNPRVALLSVGSEPTKGNRLVLESQDLFKKSGLNFVGNVEGMDMFTGKADVIVCDGFVGNVILKFAEGMGKALFSYVKERTSKSILLRPLDSMASKLWDMAARGMKTGAPLFGINGTVIVGHGASKAEAVAGSAGTARMLIERQVLEGIREEMARIHSLVQPD